jgi:hypothetical protein
MAYHTIGAKYQQVKDMDIADIAKLIRQDIKEQYPAASKSSVRIERYSMGQSLYVVIKGINATHAERVKKGIKQIVEAYNFDDSDSMTDYFHVNFYSDVRLEN